MRAVAAALSLVAAAYAGCLPRVVAAQVDPSGTWRTLHTPHFRIHFRPAIRGVAERAAREAERAWGLLATELHPPRGPVDVTLGDDADISNGYTQIFPSNRFTILLPPPATQPEEQIIDDWVRLVSVHELTHVFHLDRTTGWWRLVQSVFGRVPGFFPNDYQPSWVIEGIAVYYESKFTGSGRIDGAYHAQLIAAAARARTPWTAVYFTRWPDGQAPYAYGSRFFSRLGDVAGDSAVPRFVERTSGQLIPFRVGRQVRRATDGSRDLQTEWAAMVGEYHRAPVADSASALATALWTEPVPRVSPDGRRVAYVHDDGKSPPELWVVSADDWRVLRRHRVNGLASYDWVADTLAVTQLDFTDRWHMRGDLYAWLPPPDGAWRRQTHGARVGEPRGGGGRLITVGLTPAGNRPSLPGLDTVGAVWGDVVPSPDGRWVAATRHRNGGWALVQWPAGAPDSLAVLFAGSGVVADPVWQGNALLFVSERSGLPQIYRWTAGQGVQSVITAPLGARAPAPLPDGSVLYATFGPEGWTLARGTPGPARALSEEPTAAPPDAAPPVAVRETGYSFWPSLRPHFWIPLAADAGAAGRFGGALVSGIDAVGRTSYAADALVSVSPLRASGAFSLVSHVLGSPSLDLSGSSGWSLLGVTSGGTVVSERSGEAALGATFVLRRWRSVASLRLAAEYQDRTFTANPDVPLAAVCRGCSTRDRVGGSATVRLAHLAGGPLAIAPLGGVDWRALYRRREQQGSPLWSNEVRSRLALYQRTPGLGGFAPPVLALRLAAGGTWGPLQPSFGVGGVSSGTLAFGFGSVGGGRDFPVRGYAGGTVFGRRAATASLEYRVPLALLGQAVGHLPVGVDRLWLSVFSDVGDAWEPGERARLHRLRSVGAELVADLTVSYDLPIGLRLGLAQPLTDPPGGVGGAKRARAYVAVGSDF
jgi:hypothetical protein